MAKGDGDSGQKWTKKIRYSRRGSNSQKQLLSKFELKVKRDYNRQISRKNAPKEQQAEAPRHEKFGHRLQKIIEEKREQKRLAVETKQREQLERKQRRLDYQKDRRRRQKLFCKRNFNGQPSVGARMQLILETLAKRKDWESS